MFLRQLEIKNLRGIRRLTLRFDNTTVLIGENNTGKTTVLYALQACLHQNLTRTNSIFSEYDYHLENGNDQPVDSSAIEIILTFAETTAGEWPIEISQTLDRVVQIDSQGKQSIILKVESQYDDIAEDFITRWSFLDLARNELVNARAPRNIILLQQLAPLFYLAALRSSAQEFRPRSQFWGPFVRSMKIDSATRETIEQELGQLNEQVLNANASFEIVKERLTKTSAIVPLGTNNPVAIEALPTKVFDVLSRTQVMLSSVNNASLPIERHGEGTQSLAVICLFDAFLNSSLRERYTQHTEAILALEEPEAHLHPSAIQATIALLQEMVGQKVIASHSGDLVANIPLSSIRRFRRVGGDITVYQMDENQFDQQDLQKLNHHVRSTRGNLLFARCWLLVEGEVDRLFFEDCARVYGKDFISNGVCCVEFTQVGIERLCKLANHLGIEWVAVADKDSSGQRYLTSARSQMPDQRETLRLHQLQHGNIEIFLCMEGYGSVYEQSISSQKSQAITASQGTLSYWDQVIDAQSRNTKIPNIIAVLDEIRLKGSAGVPQQIQDIIDAACKLADEAW